MTIAHILGLIGLPEIGFIVAVAVVIFGCTAVMQNPFIDRKRKALWVATILLLNWIGLLFYYYTYYMNNENEENS